MRHGKDIWEQAQQWRGDLYTKLRGEISRLEYGRAQAFGGNEEYWERLSKTETLMELSTVI